MNLILVSYYIYYSFESYYRQNFNDHIIDSLVVSDRFTQTKTGIRLSHG